MLRQVKKYGDRGGKATYVGKDQKDETIKQQVLKGEFQLVFMSPESMLRVLKYRDVSVHSIPEESCVFGYR